jgi:hypothetical protein
MMQAAERKTYVQILGQMLIADGILADSERAYLDSVMDAFSLSPDERRGALSEISIDSPIEQRVAELSAEGKEQLRAELEKATAPGGALATSEWTLLPRVRAALG